ncbi:MAG: ABC transporter ATP-binding protein [Holophagales bacterium]|nr:ABC transporter ATP-binding protein [Holophagales bacterium]MYH27125.1 ABC transporter ATP-binding protein [Holophagales bacterium]
MGGGAMTTILCFDSVDKSYGDLEVLRSVNLEIGSGVECLVGRNGAGKTTLMRLGLGLTEPNGGTVRMFGFDPRVHPEVMARVGILLEEDELFDFLRPLEFLDYCAALYGLDAGEARARAVDLLEALEVPASGRLCHQLSTGNRRQLALAAALLHEPELLILDEPFNGLDPVAVARLCRMLRDFAANGRGVLLSSHRLELVEEIADQVYFVADCAVTPWSPERVKTWYDELRVAGAGEEPPGELTG